MDLYHRVGMYFFTIGALLAILAGAFPLAPGVYDVVLVLLIFLGVFSAVLNVGEEEELGFLVAATAFLIMIVSFKFLLGHHPLIIGLANFFEVVTFFVGSMLSVVALKTVFEFGSQRTLDALEHANAIDDHVETLMFSKQERTWNFVVFLAVAVSFIVILLEVFFELGGGVQLFFLLNIVIFLVFLVDLVVLYRKEGGFKGLFKYCWLDVVATIPFFLIFQGLNALQVIKVARLLRLGRFMKLNKTLKFMSDRSGVKHYLHGGQLFEPKTSAPKKMPRKTPKKTKR